MPASYHDLDLDFLNAEDLNVIEIKSKALSLDECFEYLCIDKSDLPDRELELCKRVFKKGRVSGISQAADKMFNSMQGRNGSQVAFEYLRHLSSTFQLEPNNPTNASAGFSFNVIMPEDKK